MLMSLVWTILIGAAAGALGKLVMPGKDPGGFWITAVLGIAGALLAKFLGQMLGIYREGQAAGFLGAVVGAVIILWIYRFIKGRKASSAARPDRPKTSRRAKGAETVLAKGKEISAP